MASQFKWAASSAFLLLNIASIGVASAGEDDGYYFGLGAGTTKISNGTNTQSLVTDITASGYGSANVNLDDKSTGFKILGGYQVNKNFSAELYYADLGTYNYTLSTMSPASNGNGNTKVTGYGVDLLGMIPINPGLSGYGSFGMYRRDATGTYQVSGSTYNNSSKVDSDVKLGVGVEWKFAPAVGLRAEWEYYDDSDASISMLSVGLVSHF